MVYSNLDGRYLVVLLYLRYLRHGIQGVVFKAWYSGCGMWGCLWYRGSVLDCWSTGRVIDPAPGA